MNRDDEPKNFQQLEFNDKDLVMFTITDLILEKRKEQVHMVITLKRKIQTELLTTYVPTLLLLIIAYVTHFFKAEYFEASVTVNLTIMLVNTTIFTSKIQELPPTSDTKMIDIWLIFCLLVPFAFALIQTAIECYREDGMVDTKRPEAWSEQSKDGQEVWSTFLNVRLICPKLQDDGRGGQDVQHIMKSDMAVDGTLKTLQLTGSSCLPSKRALNPHVIKLFQRLRHLLA